MRILYGVVGEGMGHAIRSKVVLDRLTQKHDVQVIASNRAHDFLKARFQGVRKIWGLTIVYEDNAVRNLTTGLENVAGALTGLPDNVREYFRVWQEFAPDVVVTDFETWTYLFAKVHRIPVINVDNMQVINRCAHDERLVAGWESEFRLAKAIVKAKVPFCDHYVVSTFFHPPIRKERTTLVPPILRDEVLAARNKVARGDHLLVYQTSDTNTGLAPMLEKTGLECRIYGVRRGIKEEQREGRLRYMPFSEQGFVDDLATSRGVIAGGGFTLMGEAVYLRKPMLSVPVVGQFEQALNGLYLQHLNFGRMSRTLTPEAVDAFVQAIPECEAALTRYDQRGNDVFFETLDGLLDRAAAGVI